MILPASTITIASSSTWPAISSGWGKRRSSCGNDAITVDEVLRLRPTPWSCRPALARRPRRAVRSSWFAGWGAAADPGSLPGHQTLAMALGGRVVRADRAGPRPLLADPSRRPGNLCRPAQSDARLPVSFAGRRAASLPEVFEVTAWTDDGTIMAIEHRQRPLVGIQFHPESILTDCGYPLLAAFLRRRPALPASCPRSTANLPPPLEFAAEPPGDVFECQLFSPEGDSPNCFDSIRYDLSPLICVLALHANGSTLYGHKLPVRIPPLPSAFILFKQRSPACLFWKVSSARPSPTARRICADGARGRCRHAPAGAQTVSDVDHVSKPEAVGPGRVSRHRRCRAAGPCGRRHAGAAPRLVPRRRSRGLDPGRRLPLVRVSDRLARRSPGACADGGRSRRRRAAARFFRLQPRASTRCSKRPSWRRASICCRRAKSLLNLNVCGPLVEKTGGAAKARLAFLD